MTKGFRKWTCQRCRGRTAHKVDEDHHPSEWKESDGIRYLERKRDCQQCKDYYPNLSSSLTCELDYEDLSALLRELNQLRQLRQCIETELRKCDPVKLSSTAVGS